RCHIDLSQTARFGWERSMWQRQTRLQLLGMALPHRSFPSEHGAVVARYKFFQEIPDRPVRMGKIDVAAPYPVIGAGFACLNQSRGLRVMNHHELGIERKCATIAFVVCEKNLEISRARMIRCTMQGIVE